MLTHLLNICCKIADVSALEEKGGGLPPPDVLAARKTGLLNFIAGKVHRWFIGGEVSHTPASWPLCPDGDGEVQFAEAQCLPCHSMPFAGASATAHCLPMQVRAFLPRSSCHTFWLRRVTRVTVCRGGPQWLGTAQGLRFQAIL